MLIVPAANLTSRDPVAFTAVQRVAVARAPNSDARFWAFATFTPGMLLRTLLATDPSLLARVSSDERRRAELIRDGLMPITRKIHWAGAPAQTAFERIAVPTLVVSCEDEFFGTDDTARLLADRIAGARLVVYNDGGHIWLGHDAELTREIRRSVTAASPP